MNKILKFFRKERLYILLVVFILTVNIAVMAGGGSSEGRKSSAGAKTDLVEERQEPSRAQVEELLRRNPYLAVTITMMVFLMLALIAFGVLIDGTLIAARIRGKTVRIRTAEPATPAWTLWDAGKVVILFIFFGYILVIIEALLATAFPVFKVENFKMIINSTLLDILVIVLILHFVLGERRQALRDLGLSFQNFGRNVVYGIMGYVATIPVLVLIVIATFIVITVIKYTPAKQPVVDLFLKEKGAAFLTYAGIFAAVFGPIVEELFFRGFLYSALKKRAGVFWSMAITAALFSALHTHPVGFLPIMVLGMLLAYLYEKTGSLVSSVTVHVMHNAAMVFLVFVMKQITFSG